MRIRRLDGGYGRIAGPPRRSHACRRIDDAVIARLDIGRRESRAVMKQHVGPQCERIDPPVRRHPPGFRQVALDVRIIRRVELQEGGVQGSDGVKEGKGGIGVTVVVGRLALDGELKRPASLRRRLRIRVRGETGCRQSDRGDDQDDGLRSGPDPIGTSHVNP
jgi:hypothetical protein